MAQVVYTGVTDAEGVQGTLFQGAKFWLSQKVPQRKRFIDEVKANGGEITPLEKEADIKIVDHARKEQLPGTYSYKYIEVSVRNGALEDLENHAVGGPIGTLRTLGSTIQPPKSGRTKFTPEDDRILVNWVTGIERTGGATSGNEIYKQLETKNPRHTWQSWRDRWVKSLKDLPRSAFIAQNVPTTPSAEGNVDVKAPPRPVMPLKARPKPFTKEDAEDLVENGDGIMDILPGDLNDAWSAFANSRDDPEDHSAKEWQAFWEKSIRPVYLNRKAKAASSPQEAQGPARFDTGEKDQSEQQESISLPVRSSPSLKGRNGSGSPSYRPESPTNYSKAAMTHTISVDSVAESVDGANEVRPAVGSPAKRKRLASVEIQEVPSSSPSETVRPPKRLRHGNVDSPLGEVEQPSQPGPLEHKAIEIPDTYATNKAGGGTPVEIVDYLDNDQESSAPLDEEEYDSEKSPSISPELGRSPVKSFSNTQRNVSKTQAAFEEPVLPIDYDLALPEGGFGDEDDDQGKGIRNVDGEPDDESQETEIFHSLEAEEEDERPSGPRLIPLESPSDSSSIPRSSPPAAAPPKHSQPTTQDLPAADTQQADYSLPAPEGGWDAALLPSSQPDLPPSSPPEIPDQSPPTKESPSPDPAEQLDAFIDHHLSLGFDEDDIHLALKCTSMDPVLSVKVLKAMRRNGGKVPREIKGCWTEEDDKELDSVDARRIRRLEEKHGKENFEARWAFLEEYRR
ncbi:MAG: hypothetical protein LQ338_007201 [Usnochroma carphineum]|nr:MAG: hypothetical protein LQ338_007201 [Usnochroma carphineum]